MSAPVIVLVFDEGTPFSLARLNDNFAAIAAAINALSAEPLLQIGATPGNVAQFLPITGGTLLGGLTVPSVLIGPAGGPHYAALTANDIAQVGQAGVVKQADENVDATASTVAVAAPNATTSPAGGTGTAAGGWDTAANRNLAITAINECSALANELKADVGQLITDFNALVTRFNTLQANLRTAGVLKPP